jgi:hypothetical protein
LQFGQLQFGQLQFADICQNVQRRCLIKPNSKKNVFVFKRFLFEG